MTQLIQNQRLIFKHRSINILIVEFVAHAYPNRDANNRERPTNSNLFGLGARQSGETVECCYDPCDCALISRLFWRNLKLEAAARERPPWKRKFPFSNN